MVFLVFFCVCKKVNMFLYFQNKTMLKKECVNASERYFLWFKFDRGLWVHLPTPSRSCGGIKRKAEDRNVNMILLY
jgi:hypothetical protein